HQCRTRLNDFDVELPRQFKREICCAQLRYGHAPGSHYEVRRSEVTLTGMQTKTRLRGLDSVKGAGHAPGHLAQIAFAFEHGNDFLTGLITKQLPAMLFVPTYAVAIDQTDEVARRIRRKRRAAKMRVRRDEIGRRNTRIREIAATATRNTDFLGQTFGVVHKDHAQTSLPRHRRRHHASSASPDDRKVKMRSTHCVRRPLP